MAKRSERGRKSGKSARAKEQVQALPAAQGDAPSEARPKMKRKEYEREMRRPPG